MRQFLRPAIVIVLAGCGCVAAKQVKKQQSVARFEPAQRDAIFSSSLSTLQRRGWIVAVSDRAGGLLTTQTMDTGAKACGLLTCTSRSTVQVAIADSGNVAVNLHREFFYSSLGWFVPSAEQDVRPIEQEQAEILAEIVGPVAGQPRSASQGAQAAAFSKPAFPQPRPAKFQWSAADQRAFVDRCQRDSTAHYGAKRTAAQIQYGCECLAWGVSDRYSVAAFGQVVKENMPAFQQATTEINAECKKSLPGAPVD